MPDAFAESTPIEPEAELVGEEDQPDTMLDAEKYENEGGRGQVTGGADEEDLEGTAWAFEEKAEQAENDAALDKELEGTFPTSDPPSSWAGPDIEAERPDETADQ